MFHRGPANFESVGLRLLALGQRADHHPDNSAADKIQNMRRSFGYFLHSFDRQSFLGKHGCRSFRRHQFKAQLRIASRQFQRLALVFVGNGEQDHSFFGNIDA